MCGGDQDEWGGAVASKMRETSRPTSERSISHTAVVRASLGVCAGVFGGVWAGLAGAVPSGVFWLAGGPGMGRGWLVEVCAVLIGASLSAMWCS